MPFLLWGMTMADVNVTFDVVDKFSQKMNDFENRLKKLEGNTGKMDKATESMGKSAEKTGFSFKGFGGAMFIVNQALQAFQKIAEHVKGALDDIADRERAIIMMGPEAGNALADFAKDSARALGRSTSEIMKAGLQWKETGVGGSDIMTMTALADRFANLNPGKSYADVASAFNDAVKSKNVGGLADLLGGGEGVEKKLQRKGVERALRRGDVSGAMKSFTEVAEGFGYTQEKADKMGMTITRKIDRIVDRVSNKVTELFSGIVQKAEPAIDEIVRWLDSDEVDIFLDNVQTAIWNTVDVVSSAFQMIADGWEQIGNVFHGFWDDAVGESTSMIEMLVGIFVGGTTQIGGSIYNIIAHTWNIILTGIEGAVNGVIGLVYGVRNKIVSTLYDIRNKVALTIADVLKKVTGIADRFAGTAIGDFLGIADMTGEINAFADSLDSIGHNQASLWDAEAAKMHLDGAKMDTFDSVQRAAENIEGVMNWINGFSVDNRNKEAKKTNAILGAMKPELSKIRGAMTHEQDLRWLKERAEQRYINNVNVRQLTPTINVKISGTNVKASDVEKTINKVLQQQAAAGTFNAYGEVV